MNDFGLFNSRLCDMKLHLLHSYFAETQYSDFEVRRKISPSENAGVELLEPLSELTATCSNFSAFGVKTTVWLFWLVT